MQRREPRTKIINYKQIWWYQYGLQISWIPFEDGNYAIVEINYIGIDMKPNIDIDNSRLDTIPYDHEDDCLIAYKCNKCK